MKLVTYTAGSGPRVGARTEQGQIVDLCHGYYAFKKAQGEEISESVANATVPPEMVTLLEAGEPALEAVRSVLEFVQTSNQNRDKDVVGPWYSQVVYDEGDVRLLSPILSPRKIIGIGLNYRDHAEEQGSRLPKAPMMFSKFSSSLIGASESIVYPSITEQLDYEAELAFIVGKRGKNVSAERAFEHIAGYCIFNDVTARDIQLGDRQWVRGKTPDAITPVGPYLVTADEVLEPNNLAIRLWLNGELMQDSRTDQLIWGIPFLVEFLSHSFTLEPGDIVATGTPSGVGFVRQPPVFMNPGDTVRVEIEGLGSIENSIVTEDY